MEINTDAITNESQNIRELNQLKLACIDRLDNVTQTTHSQNEKNEKF